MTQLTCDLGTGFDLKKFCHVLYVQYRYMQALNITNPSFVFTLPPDQRDKVENAIIIMWKATYGADVAVELRTEHSTILGLDEPKVSRLRLHYPQILIVLMDQPDWDKLP